MKKPLVALIVFAGCAAAQIVNPGGNGGGGGGSSLTPAGNVGDLQTKASSSALGASHINDNGTTLTASEPVVAPSLSTGGTPPTLTPGTGGAEAYAEGTVPGTCASSGVDCIYGSATQHGLLASFNNGPYLPLVQGPASATSGHVATFNGTNGGLLQDGGALPTVTGGTCTNQVVTAISSSAVPTCTTITSSYTTGFALLAAANNFTVGPQNLTLNSLGTTQTDGWELFNTTAAAAGAQQISPSLTFQAQAWNTTVTAASNTILGYLQLFPVQGASTAVDGLFQFQSKIGANGVRNVLQFSQQFGNSSDGNTPWGSLWLGNVTATATNFLLNTTQFSTTLNDPSGSGLKVANGNSISVQFLGSGLKVASSGLYAFTSTTPVGTVDAALSRDAAGIIDFGTGASGNVAGSFKATSQGTIAVLTANLKICSSGGSTPTGINSYAGAVSDATVPALGVALTGGGTVWAHVHCSLTTGTYIVDGI